MATAEPQKSRPRYREARAPATARATGSRPTDESMASNITRPCIPLEAGFKRRDGIVLIRVISNLLAGYLLLLRQDDATAPEQLGPREVELLRKRMELAQLSLPPDEFPNLA